MERDVQKRRLGHELPPDRSVGGALGSRLVTSTLLTGQVKMAARGGGASDPACGLWAQGRSRGEQHWAVGRRCGGGWPGPRGGDPEAEEIFRASPTKTPHYTVWETGSEESLLPTRFRAAHFPPKHSYCLPTTSCSC